MGWRLALLTLLLYHRPLFLSSPFLNFFLSFFQLVRSLGLARQVVFPWSDYSITQGTGYFNSKTPQRIKFFLYRIYKNQQIVIYLYCYLLYIHNVIGSLVITNTTLVQTAEVSGKSLCNLPIDKSPRKWYNGRLSREFGGPRLCAGGPLYHKPVILSIVKLHKISNYFLKMKNAGYPAF